MSDFATRPAPRAGAAATSRAAAALCRSVLGDDAPVHVLFPDGSTFGAVDAPMRVTVRSPDAFVHLVRAQGELGLARAYVEANREGRDWLLRFCEQHDVPFQRRTAATFAASRGEVAAVRREHRACERAGLPVTWADELDVPFPTYGATVLPDQAQLDPVEVLHALVEQLRAHGGTLHQGQRLLSAEVDGTGVTAMGAAAVSAATATAGQLAGVPAFAGWTDAQRLGMVAITPMLGRNDTGEVFTLADAGTVGRFARSAGLAGLSWWELTRDQPCASGIPAYMCSGVQETRWAFSRAFVAAAG